MKHLKKPTRAQRKYLEQKKIKTDGIMIEKDTPEYMVYVMASGESVTIQKRKEG